MTLKHCSRCDSDKPRSEFYKDKQTRDGFTCYCKPCVIAYQTAAVLRRREIKKRREAAMKAAPNPKSKRSEG